MNSSIRRILPIALVAALLGGSVGAFVMRAPKTAEAVNTTPAQSADTSASLNTEQAAFRDGFEEGFLTAQDKGALSASYDSALQERSVVNRGAWAGNSTNQTQAYNHYVRRQPQTRSFWQKHRDKLTVAAGTGGGALIGGLFGGKKGALIGALAGGGGSALYTYKIRKRARRY